MKFLIRHLLLIFMFLMQNSLGTVMAAQMQFQQLLAATPTTHVVVVAHADEKSPCPHHSTQQTIKGVADKSAKPMQVHCDLTGCNHCQCVSNLNFIIALPSLSFVAISHQGQYLDDAPLLTDSPLQTILRPPKS